MAGTDEKDVKKKALHKPKRTNLHLMLVMASITVTLILSFVAVNSWLHLVSVIPSIPVLTQEILDKVIFHEDLIEEVIEERR